MANFNMHLGCALSLSGVAASICIAGDLVTTHEALLLWLTGTLGGLLPDVDSSNSSSLKIIFNTIMLLVSIIMFISLSNTLPLGYIWLLISALYLCSRWIALPLFKKYTKHRGCWHSLLVGCFASSVITSLSWNILSLNITLSWLLGIFLLLGFVTHLFLDEIYSIDLSHKRIKSSFGTAMKPFSLKSINISLSVMGLQLLLLTKFPPLHELENILYILARTWPL